MRNSSCSLANPGSTPSTRPARPGRLVAGAALLGAPTVVGVGCVIVDDDHHGPHYYYGPDYYEGAVYTTIDADQVMNTDLGDGVGLFVEYRAGGTWRLWTSCDTNITGVACKFDVYVLAYSTIHDVYSESLEAYDHVDVTAADELIFYAETGVDSDAVEFDAEPGASVELELVLDDYVDPTFIYWVGDGHLHEGAAGSPVIFDPDLP